MSQAELDETIARTTGEELREVRRLGFSIADPLDIHFDPEPYDLQPQVVDWDEAALSRHVPFFP
jgi:hypothetical protein